MKKVSFWQATATLIGTIIGAGILGVPFVIAKVGVGPGFLLLIILGVATLLINLMFAEIVLRTKIRHQIAGYAKKYLGRTAYGVGIVSLLIGSYGALTAYLIGEGEVLSTLIGMGDAFWYSIGFFILGAVILFFGLNIIKVLELWLVAVFIVIILVIVGISGTSIDLANLQFADWSNLFLPYGVILFAYGGVGAIVPLREILRRKEKQVKKAVIWGTIVPMAIYTVFAIVVVGVTGTSTSDVATLGLGQAIGPYMVLFGNLFAFFAMGTSFLTIGLVIKEFFQFDLRLNKFWSWLLVMIVPLLLFLFGSRDFIGTMGVAGSLAFGLTGLIIVLMYWKAKKAGNRKPEFSMPKFKLIGGLLMLMFVLGVVYAVWDLIK